MTVFTVRAANITLSYLLTYIMGPCAAWTPPSGKIIKPHAARDSETAASPIDDVHLFVRLFVCLSVSLSVAKMQKRDFLETEKFSKL